MQLLENQDGDRKFSIGSNTDKIFKLAPCLPPRCLASPDTWPPTDRARDRRGRFGGLQVHQEGELLEDVQLSLKHQHQLIQTSCLPARFSSALHFCPPLPPAALLSQHHSHFLASPVGYLYERG